MQLGFIPSSCMVSATHARTIESGHGSRLELCQGCYLVERIAFQIISKPLDVPGGSYQDPQIWIMTFYFLLLPYLISKAPCTEIIERATSIVDYDLRDEKLSPDTAGSVTRVCPVLHDLYQADPTMSDSCSQSLSMLLFVVPVYYIMLWCWLNIFVGK